MNKKTLLSICTVIIYTVLAASSIDLECLGFTAIFTIISFVVLAIIVTIIYICIISRRTSLIKKDEKACTDFDRTNKYGDDRGQIYFDENKSKVMILYAKTTGLVKQVINDFNFSGKSWVYCDDAVYFAMDTTRRKILFGNGEDGQIKCNVIDLKRYDGEYRNDSTNYTPLLIKFDQKRIAGNTETTTNTLMVVVEPNFGNIYVFEKNMMLYQSSYLNKLAIQKLNGGPSVISSKNFKNYLFLMDDNAEVLVIISRNLFKIINYSDIISILFEENGQSIFTKSTTRTVGGALVGGALLGGAGAVIGGLSGSNKQNKIVKSMNLKILIRDTNNVTINLNFMLNVAKIDTSNSFEMKTYQAIYNDIVNIKDLLSVIIDKINQKEKLSFIENKDTLLNSAGIADELAKLAKLRDDGILTEDEFADQKAKLLNK